MCIYFFCARAAATLRAQQRQRNTHTTHPPHSKSIPSTHLCSVCGKTTAFSPPCVLLLYFPTLRDLAPGCRRGARAHATHFPHTHTRTFLPRIFFSRRATDNAQSWSLMSLFLQIAPHTRATPLPFLSQTPLGAGASCGVFVSFLMMMMVASVEKHCCLFQREELERFFYFPRVVKKRHLSP